MTHTVKRWGNSLALRLPKDFIQTLGLDEGSQVEMTLEEGKLVIAPRNMRLEKLLEALESYGQPDPHGEADWGDDVGKERF